MPTLLSGRTEFDRLTAALDGTRWKTVVCSTTECGLGLTAPMLSSRRVCWPPAKRHGCRWGREGTGGPLWLRRRAHVAVSAFVNCPCAFTPGNPLGSEPGARFTSAPSNSIVERAADAVDVIDDSDRQRGLSAETPSLRRAARRFSRAVECALRRCW